MCFVFVFVRCACIGFFVVFVALCGCTVEGVLFRGRLCCFVVSCLFAWLCFDGVVFIGSLIVSFVVWLSVCEIC